MDLKSLGPKVSGVLRDMGVTYDPQRLAEALRGRELDLTSRGTKVHFWLSPILSFYAFILQSAFISVSVSGCW